MKSLFGNLESHDYGLLYAFNPLHAIDDHNSVQFECSKFVRLIHLFWVAFVFVFWGPFQLRRRQLLWALYVMRNPFFDRYTRYTAPLLRVKQLRQK